MGLRNNLKFLKRVAKEKVFQQGDYDTSYIEQYSGELLKKQNKISNFDVISSVLILVNSENKKINLPAELIGYKNVPGQKHTHKVEINETFIEETLQYTVVLQASSHSAGTATLNGETFEYSLAETPQ